MELPDRLTLDSLARGPQRTLLLHGRRVQGLSAETFDQLSGTDDAVFLVEPGGRRGDHVFRVTLDLLMYADMRGLDLARFRNIRASLMWWCDRMWLPASVPDFQVRLDGQGPGCEGEDDGKWDELQHRLRFAGMGLDGLTCWEYHVVPLSTCPVGVLVEWLGNRLQLGDTFEERNMAADEIEV